MVISPLTYKHYGIPVSYIGCSYKDLELSATRAKSLEKKLKAAPKSGLLVVKGVAAPVINQQVELGKSVAGINFAERSNSAFESFTNPKADIILVYGIGDEVTTNYNISRQVLNGILAYYKHRDTLVVIETVFGKTELRNNYDLTPTNFLTLEEKPEVSFLN